MRPNTTLRAWRAGQKTIGAWLSAPSAHTTEVMAHAGFDWLCVDMQHGLIGDADAMNMLRAISTTETIPFVRVPWNEPWIIMKVLDAGAYGVVVPLVNNKEEAERAVWAAKYPPMGGRSSGPARATLYAGSDYQAHANDEIAVVVMIETPEGIANLDEILSVPGVDAAYVGPSDLAYALGMQPTGDNADPKHKQTCLDIMEACKRHNVAPGMHTGSLEYTKMWLEAGFQMVTLGSEVGFMRAKAASDLAAARGDTNTPRVEPEA
ncbi:MAG: 2,4-dihydroxyhept-2-ene-1,7-dioic acid aldolase [Dehalococcoidia bacterium]|nr:2,4-dihydroxyhept-2-ene-1,7-dioic acid aldolase [Dehalococcoidia bacterium]MCA9856846.1 2,4-dihydroxyhept-2-ene-1,7-dioic acid aldolase [Dehalococcoidia bacterium]MCB9482675.1 2,4-dihydroxyhept-2-ene-1,7-dioic acid aldolase [Dehalococcoidia bacterium]MCB9491919.1 2,4-dihydroxyhept-2-ene-1,7-dioic acid aldolase [Dehalococcoidia bacterium]